MPSDSSNPRIPAHDGGLRGPLNRNQFLRLMAASGAAIALPGVLAACGSDDSANAVDAGRGEDGVLGEIGAEEVATLTWAITSGAARLDPPAGIDTAQWTLESPSLETLLTYDGEGNVVGLLAETSEQVDPTTYRYQIRDATFWNGDPLTVDDVIFSLDRNRADDSAIASYLQTIRSIRAVDDRTVEIRLNEPYSLFENLLALASAVTQRSFVEEHGDEVGTPEVLVMGTGPYRLTEIRPDEAYSYERFDGYWGERPAVRQLEIRIIPDTNTQYLAAQSGEIDGGFEIGVREAAQWRRTGEHSVSFIPNLWTVFVSMDTTSPPFDDLNVRKAVAHCIDREGLVRSALLGRGEAAGSIVPPGSWAGLMSEDEARRLVAGMPQYPFDLEAARAALAASAYPDGFETETVYGPEYSRVGQVAQNLARNLEQIGITLNVREVTSDEWFGGYGEKGDTGLYMVLWAPEAVDPADNIRAFLLRDGLNVARFEDEAVEEAMAEYFATEDAARRTEILTEVIRTSLEQVPYAPVWFEEQAIGLRNDLALRAFPPIYVPRPWVSDIGMRA